MFSAPFSPVLAIAATIPLRSRVAQNGPAARHGTTDPLCCTRPCSGRAVGVRAPAHCTCALELPVRMTTRAVSSDLRAIQCLPGAPSVRTAHAGRAAKHRQAPSTGGSRDRDPHGRSVPPLRDTCHHSNRCPRLVRQTRTASVRGCAPLQRQAVSLKRSCTEGDSVPQLRKREPQQGGG